MTEPFLYLIPTEPAEPIYSERAPMDFKNPNEGIWIVPLTSQILSGEREMYTKDDIAKSPEIWKTALSNTKSNSLRKNTENEFLSIRSNKTDMPCAALFVLKSKKKAFSAVGVDPSKYFIIFITPDEIMLADKAKFKPTQIKATVKNIKNKMNSIFNETPPSPILSTALFEYDKENDRYVEF